MQNYDCLFDTVTVHSEYRQIFVVKHYICVTLLLISLFLNELMQEIHKLKVEHFNSNYFTVPNLGNIQCRLTITMIGYQDHKKFAATISCKKCSRKSRKLIFCCC